NLRVGTAVSARGARMGARLAGTLVVGREPGACGALLEALELLEEGDLPPRGSRDARVDRAERGGRRRGDELGTLGDDRIHRALRVVDLERDPQSRPLSRR